MRPYHPSAALAATVTVIAGIALAACSSADASSTPAQDDGGPTTSPPVSTNAPDAASDSSLPDGSSTSPCTPPNVARGAIDVLYTDTATAAPYLKSVAVRCNNLYLTSGSAEGVPTPWKIGYLKTCAAASCAGSMKDLAFAGLHFPARVTSTPEGIYVWPTSHPYSGLGGPPPDTAGDVLRIEASGEIKNLGVLFTFDITYKGLTAIPGYLQVDSRSAAPNGTWVDSTVLKTDGSGALVGRQEGGQMTGFTGFATPTRLFVEIGSPTGGGLDQVNPAAGAARTPFLTSNVAQPFAFGERVGAIEYGAADGGDAYSLSLCESDNSCAAPLRHPFADGATATYFGTVGDELLLYYAAADATTATLKSCSRTQLMTGCTPQTVASSLPLSDGSPTATDGKALFYLSKNRSVVRVGL